MSNEDELSKAFDEEYIKHCALFPKSEYERGFIDGMQKQMQSSVDKAVNAVSRTWVELTDHEIEMIYAVTIKVRKKDIMPEEQKMFAKTIQHFLKERNT
jgi:hypothetical protein